MGRSATMGRLFSSLIGWPRNLIFRRSIKRHGISNKTEVQILCQVYVRLRNARKREGTWQRGSIWFDCKRSKTIWLIFIDGILSFLNKKEADFTSTAFAITPTRYPRLDVATNHNWEEPYRMVVPRPGEQDRLFAFIKPFDVDVPCYLAF